MSSELIEALKEIEKERGIDREVIISAIEEALSSSYKKDVDSKSETRVEFNRDNGNVKIFARKTVVESVKDESSEISLESARRVSGVFEIGDIVEVEITTKNFGRLAAQKAKQVIVQKIKEEERNMIFEEFYAKENDIVTGTIQRIEHKGNEKFIYVDLGKIEAVLLPGEQVSNEHYKLNERIKTYVLSVKKTSKDPRIVISRTHPGLVKRLFELEVPEIHDGTVEIKSISREPGSRTKIAVYSKDENVDPVGACVGQKGTRVQVIVDELRGEKIDIIKWSPMIEEFICSSLSPAKVVRVDINDEDKSALVIVPDSQLSLAIGKEGQNVRLAAKLTNWRIDIKSESKLRANIEESLFRDYYGEDADVNETEAAGGTETPGEGEPQRENENGAMDGEM
ncbi:MAG: transcription termination factor NusA [Clostridiales bacterium]|nr:transcription termination factor NusA [Clostridiales bacterium]